MTIRSNPGLADDRFPAALTIERQLRFLIRYAIPEPWTRITQPWRFTIERNVIRLWADPARRLPVADPDCRELHLSLGWALENLLVAAGCAGLRYEVACFTHAGMPDLAAVVTFHPGASWGVPRVAALQALTLRHPPHRPFEARTIEARLLDRLRGVRGEPGVRVSLSTSAEHRRAADVLTVRAVGILFADEAYREERMRRQDGGTWDPPKPHAPGRHLARQLSAVTRTAPVIGVVGSLADGRADQLRSGRVLERLWLAATMEGLALQPIGYVLQAPVTREALAATFPEAGTYSQVLFRLGYAEPRSAAAAAG